VVVHTAPRDTETFSLVRGIIPRITVPAGFEQATGIPRQQVRPTAAEHLRCSVTIHICTTIAAPPGDVWSAVERIVDHTSGCSTPRPSPSAAQRTRRGAEFDCLTKVGPLHTTDASW